MADLLLGLDAGGGAIRALLLDPERGPLACARRPWAHRPAPGTGGLGIDLDLAHTWRALVEATQEAIARAGAAPGEIAGVAASAMRFANVILAGDGAPVFAAPNRDGRATPASFELLAEGAALHARTGHGPTPIALLPRLRWLAREHGARIAHALSLSDWIAWRLCGAIATDRSQASTSGLLDVARCAWAEDVASASGLRLAWLPAIVGSGTRLGSLDAEAARELGLRAGIAVAAGGADTQCGLLGAGAVAGGAAGVVAGTSAPVQMVSERAVFDPETRAWTECHVVPGRWVVESNAGPIGEALDWSAALLFPDAPQPTARLFAEAARAPQGARGLVACFGAPVSDPRALGIPVTSLAFSPLVAARDPERRRLAARAFAEGAAFAVRANLERAARVAGAAPAAVHAGGGMSASATWLALLADALSTPIHVGPSPESSAIGAALCAGVGAGVFRDLADAAARPAGSRVAAAPDPERAAACESQFAVWLRHAEARAPADAPASERLLPELLRERAGGETAAVGAVAPRILATADLDAASLAALRALGPVEHASFREAMRLLSGSALVEALDGCAVLVTEVDVLDAAALAKLPALRVVAACRGDAVNVDVDACTAYGIPVLYAPGRNADAVADLSVACALALLRKLPEASAFLRQPGVAAGDLGRMGQAFSQLRGRELAGKTVGLVGLGAVGRAVARRLRGFGARVVAHDPFVSVEGAALADAEWLPLDALLAESDVVSLHAPVTDATRGLLDAAALARMKPGALLVNTARAALVDEAALAEALRSGHLAGAALDVFSVEPPGADHPLLQLPNVIATPHIGGNTHEVAAHQGRIVAADLARLVRGEPPLCVRNPETLARFSWSEPRAEPDRARLEALAGRAGPAVSDLQRDGATALEIARPARVSGDVDAGVRARMERILAGFVARAIADAELARFAADRDVTLHFTLADLDLAFWLRLRAGLDGALGAPDGRPEVNLRLRADVLDGMFTGRVNPMQAAMQGRLSFTGDAAKAMTLQQIQPALARHYRASRDAVGDPGDLAALPDPSGAASATPAAGGDALREELVQVVRELYAQELITATGGNVSARVPGREEAWITPSQLFKGDLRPEILVRIGLDGATLETRGAAPSSERLMHCAVYRARPEAQAVVHAHAPHATILANAGLPFLPISTEAAFFGEIPRVPFVMPGTDELARAVEEAARGSWAVLLVNHGLLVAGRSLRRVADMAEIVERSAQVILGCHAVGREPPVLPAKLVSELRAMGDLVA
jgi:autoinducer 2 (AI-2) kinase